MAVYHVPDSPLSLRSEIGTQLAKIRLARNITQQTLAEEAGIGLRTLRRLETGQTSSFDSFLRIVIALSLTDELLGAFPSHEIRPIERMDSRRQERKRARLDKSAPDDVPWSWGES